MVQPVSTTIIGIVYYKRSTYAIMPKNNWNGAGKMTFYSEADNLLSCYLRELVNSFLFYNAHWENTTLFLRIQSLKQDTLSLICSLFASHLPSKQYTQMS